MNRLKFALVLLFAPLALHADTLTVGSPISGITLTVSDNALKSMGYSQGVDAYIDPYQGVFDGQSVVLFCVDPDHFDGSGAYSVNVSAQGQGSSTEQVVYHGLSTTQAAALYGAEAYLAEELLNSSNQTTSQELQAAIWQLADPSATYPDFTTNSAFNNAVASDEATALSATNIPSFEILTDSNCISGGCSNTRQEYLVLTPEPSSIALSISGLFALVGFRRKRLGLDRDKN